MPASTPLSPEPFTHAAYARLLESAIASGYRFETFDVVRNAKPAWPTPMALLRHDIDYDPRRVEVIAAIERDRGARATYFFQDDSLYYRLDDPATHAVVRSVLQMGHALGLHFDATRIASDARVIEAVESTATKLEDRFGVSIEAVSFHMPTRRPVGHLALSRDRVNAYAPKFFSELEYASDSNQNWRGKDVDAIFREHRPPAIQVLTHPIWWRERFTPFIEVMRELSAYLKVPLDALITPEQRAIYDAV